MGGTFGMSRIAAAILLSAALATNLAAQSADTPGQSPAELEQKAESYLADMEKWNRAADLYRQAAGLRLPGDPVAVADLKSAARLEFYQGSERQAVRDLEAAGQLALGMGDVIAAANAFVDAAWIAGNDGDGNIARSLFERAQLLALSPLISTQDRDEIESRLLTTGS